MTHPKLVLVLFLIIAVTHSRKYTLNLFKDAETRKVQCNDGTPSGYYTNLNPDSNQYIFYLIGGGLCVDYESCTKRASKLISSNPWPRSVDDYPGIMSTNPDSGNFSSWNKIFVIYCTSDLYSGLNDPHPPLDYYFHGSNIVPAVMEDLHDLFQNATDVLFCGGSAGGIGVFMNWDVVQQQLSHVPNLKMVSDAGWFLSTVVPYSKDVEPLPEMIERGYKLWNGQVPVDCKNYDHFDPHNCYFGPIAYSFLKNRQNVLIQKAQTDTWVMNYNHIKTPPSPDEMTWLYYLADQVRYSYDLVQVDNVFSANCMYHTSIVSLWDTVIVNNVTLRSAVEDWYFALGSDYKLFDTCPTPMCNLSCMKENKKQKDNNIGANLIREISLYEHDVFAINKN
eukprot:TRINITY_DN987_c0_g1_i1.p1 TRINITY_DN987_c0_g1~~TRINITY_DN987_c0_g1_i1.p1  ORF type:complete len:393 (+),score=54.19 TRINITY_DN987_c0_g1_i1:204-1382(+)